MENKIQISFDKEFITVQTKSVIKKLHNLMATHNEWNKIVAIGETEEEISKFNNKMWVEEKHKVVFKPIYDFIQFNIDNVAISIWWLVASIYKHKRHIRKLTCNLRIPKYETFPQNTKEHFEYSVQSRLKFRKLIINGLESPLSGRKLVFSSASLEYGRWIGLALFLYLTYHNIDFLGEKLGFLFLLFLAIGMALSVWAVEVLWLFFMKTILSKKFTRLIFQQGYDTGGWSTSKTLTNLILGKENLHS